MEFPPLSAETAEHTDERYLLTTIHQRQQHIQTNDVQTMRMMTWRLFLPHFRTRPNTVSQVNLWILTRLIGSYIRSWKRPGDLPRVIEILCLFASGAQRNERKDNNFYHEWKITRAFPTTHVSTYFFRKPITFTLPICESYWFTEEIGTYMRCWESPCYLPFVIEIVVFSLVLLRSTREKT
jgi:hypothetical protein